MLRQQPVAVGDTGLGMRTLSYLCFRAAVLHEDNEQALRNSEQQWQAAHRGFARLGHADAVVVGLENAVGPGLQRVAHVDHDAAGDVRAGVPALHLRSQLSSQRWQRRPLEITRSSHCVRPAGQCSDLQQCSQNA